MLWCNYWMVFPPTLIVEKFVAVRTEVLRLYEIVCVRASCENTIFFAAQLLQFLVVRRLTVVL